MRKLINIIFITYLGFLNIFSIGFGAVFLTGAGSSFAYPILTLWTVNYHKKTGIEINYQPIGSGGGIQQLKVNTVNFALSDLPIDNNTLQNQNWHQEALLRGGIVPIVNLKNIKNNQLILDGDILAKIYLGNITYWDDNAIKILNANLKLPHRLIIPVYRADGSGTTFNFTYYLSEVNPDWAKKIGYNTQVEWPVGIGAKGSAGVVAQVLNLPNSIGYVEYSYSKTTNMTMIKLKNKNNKIVTASYDSFAAAVKNNINNKNNLLLINITGDDSWPIVATTFLIFSNNLSENILKNLANFFNFCRSSGLKSARDLDYLIA